MKHFSEVFFKFQKLSTLKIKAFPSVQTQKKYIECFSNQNKKIILTPEKIQGRNRIVEKILE